MIAWKWLRSGRAPRRPGCKRRTPRRLSAGFHPLEPRAMMSVDGLPSAAFYDASAALISPVWFEQLSFSMASRVGAGGFSLEKATGQMQWKGATLDVYNDEWIVQLTREALTQVHSVAEVAGLLAPADYGVEVIGGLGLEGQLLVRVSAGSDEAAAAWLQSNPALAYYEPNAILPLEQTPNDSSFGQLWGLHNTGQSIGGQYGTADADIDAPEAWNLAIGSSSIVVGVIDTGVDYTHPDLAANIWTNPGEIAGNGRDDDGNGFVDDVHGYDFVNNDGNPMDDNGHGTHCAGTIAAVGNNGSGVAGVNWTSSVMALKFLSGSGSGTTSDAVRALNYATMMRTRYSVNVRLTSNSWGGGGYSQSLYDAIAASGQAGTMFVAAAGNSAGNNDTTPNYPSNYNLDNIIAVAATDNRDTLASFSCYGATTVDLAAPGVNIYSTRPGGGYQFLSGTSMATPHVSGVVALAWSVAPSASLSEIRNAVLGGVDRVAALSGKVATGGRLNARGTLELLGMSVVGSAPAAGSVVSTRPTEFTVTFSQNYDPASVQASDLVVNGLPANSFALLNATTVKFIYNTLPITSNGPQLMQMAEGAVLRSGGQGVHAWQATFYYDQVPMAVVATNPVQGAVLFSAPGYITLDFNEAIASGTVGVDDLTLNSGSVTAATLLDADTVRYTVSLPTMEGQVVYTLRAGGLTDLYGTPGPGYAGSFTIDDPAVVRYVSSDVPLLIVDQGTISSSVTISDNRVIRDLDVEVDITHTWDADLDVYLLAPNGMAIELFTDVGGSGQNFTRTILDDEAGTSIRNGTAPFTGRFRPEGSLAMLDGQRLAGLWRLVVTDDAAQDVGVLNAWALQFRVNQAPVLAHVGDQALSHRQDSLALTLAASDADGDSLTYSATVVPVDALAQRAYELDQQLGLRYLPAIDNLHGAQEKWVLSANGQLYALLPNGDLRHWVGMMSLSPVVAQLSTTYYASPALLCDALPPASMLGGGDMTLSLEGSQLTVRPRAGALGTAWVQVNVSDGWQTTTEAFRVAVTNNAPVLEGIGDQSISHRQGELRLTLSATDADADPLSYSATVLAVDPLAQRAYELNQSLQLRYLPNIDNLHGAQEKWMLSANGQLYALLPNGDLRHWTGIMALSPVVSQLSAAYYADPALLCNAQSPSSMLGPNDVTLSLQGSQLVLQPRSGAVGTARVQVVVSDALQTDSETFRFQVTNVAPALSPIGDQTILPGQENLTLHLAGTDADGDPVSYSAAVLAIDPLSQQAYDLNQQLQLRYLPNIDNLHGAQEKWMLSANGQLYALLPNGEVRHWTGIMSLSPVVARLSAVYYADPSLLCNAQAPSSMLGPSDVTLSLQGSQLVIQPRSGAVGAGRVQVGVSDGAQTASQAFRVSVGQVAPAAASLDLPAALGDRPSAAAVPGQPLTAAPAADFGMPSSLPTAPGGHAAWFALLADEVHSRWDPGNASWLDIDGAVAAHLYRRR